MGIASHSVEKFGSPFVMVDELVFIIPASSVLELKHHRVKMLFILSGECEQELEGLTTSERLREGDIVFAPAVKYHRYINNSATAPVCLHVVRLFLDSRTVKEADPRHRGTPDSSLEKFLLHHFSEPLHLTGGITPEIRTCLQALRAESEGRETGFRHRVRALCTELVVLVARAKRSRSSGTRRGQSTSFVEAAKEYILKHFSDPDLRLGEIAYYIGKGDEHLARQFRRETGQSVFAFVREIRINHAKTLLLNPRLPLTSIAKACGFNSLAFFSRSFKQITSHSPTRYREGLNLQLQPGPVPSLSGKRARP